MKEKGEYVINGYHITYDFSRLFSLDMYHIIEDTILILWNIGIPFVGGYMLYKTGNTFYLLAGLILPSIFRITHLKLR